jgi:hypothetical protein
MERRARSDGEQFWTGLTGAPHDHVARNGTDFIGRWEYRPWGMEWVMTPEAEITDLQAVLANSDEWCRVRALCAADAALAYDAAFQQWRAAEEALFSQ